MSDKTLDPEQQKAMREDLENQAQLLGVDFRPNISDEKLAQRVKAAKEGSQEQGDTDSDEPTKVKTSPSVKLVPQEELKIGENITKMEMRNKAKQRVRVQVSCLDPAKKDWQGEVLSISNRYIDESMFVPFDVPWHLPIALIKMIQSKQYQQFRTRKDKFGNTTRYGINVPAFNVTFLNPLTEDELQGLAKKQMARGTED